MFCYNYYTNLDGHDKLPKYCDLNSKDQKKSLPSSSSSMTPGVYYMFVYIIYADK